MTMKHIVVGHPKLDAEHLLGDVQMDDCEYLDELVELLPEGKAYDKQALVDQLMLVGKAGKQVYLARYLGFEEVEALEEALVAFPKMLVDEQLLMLASYYRGPVTGPDAFHEACLDALDAFDRNRERVVFRNVEDDDSVAFHAPFRAHQAHTIRWCSDNTIELDGVVLRHTAIQAMGYFKSDLLGGKVLTPAEVIGFVAARMAVVGVEDLLGYGRAFGPGEEDHTNATLSRRSREFRANAVVGVVACSLKRVSKAGPEDVIKVADTLRREFPEVPLMLHQMGREIYWGWSMVEAFRASVWTDVKSKKLMLEMGAKSTKHARVDSGAYVLYTDEPENVVTLPALIGNWEVSNDGSVYAPNALLSGVKGYLKESVVAVKDHAGMTPELAARYFATELLVAEGDVIEPGDVIFTVDGIDHSWESKADYGIVRTVVDEIERSGKSRVVRIGAEIDAYFVGDFKTRGLGKGLVSSCEAAGITGRVKGERGQRARLLLGAPGILKDSRAADVYIVSSKPVVGVLTAEYAQSEYDLMVQKHLPVKTGKKLVRAYPEVGVTLEFHNSSRTIVTTDERAVEATVQIQIEAAPVGQSVGSSGMTMPQMAYLASLPAGNAWLKQMVLPGVNERINALTYLHAVSNQIQHGTLEK